MTPTNTQMTPEIENIMDNEDVKHTVVPTPHTHSQSEVIGLEDFMTIHSHKIDKHYNDTYAYVDAKLNTGIGQANIEIGISDSGELEYQRKVAITWENIKNLERALLAPDSAPTANSDNLVTSGGVKAALDEKMGIMSFDSVPTAGSNNLVKSGKIREALQYEGNINPMTINESLGSQAIENIVPWYSDGCVELHYLLMKTAGSDIPIKNLFHSNTCQTYYADDLGDLTTTRWAAITIRKTVTGASNPVCVITLDGAITPS